MAPGSTIAAGWVPAEAAGRLLVRRHSAGADSHSTAGDGVVIADNRDQLAAAITRLLQPSGLDLGDAAVGSVMLQAHVPGKIHFYVGVAWKGELLAGFAVDKLEGEPMGPTTASRYFRSKPMHELTARLARGFNLTGIFSP